MNEEKMTALICIFMCLFSFGTGYTVSTEAGAWPESPVAVLSGDRASLFVGGKDFAKMNGASDSSFAEEEGNNELDGLSDASTAATLGYEEPSDADLQSVEVPVLPTPKQVVVDTPGIRGRLRRVARFIRLLIRRAVQRLVSLFWRRNQEKMEKVCVFRTIPEEKPHELRAVRSFVRQVASASSVPQDTFTNELHRIIPLGRPRRFRTESGEKVYLARRDFLGGGSFGRVYELCGEGPGGCFAGKLLRVTGPHSSDNALRLLESETAIFKLFAQHKKPEELVKRHHLAVPVHLIKFDSPKTMKMLRDGSSLINAVLLMPRLHSSLHAVVKSIEGNFSHEANEARDSIGRQILQVLASMEELGLLHGDVKSANMFVASSGKVYLGDFGFAVPIGSKTSCWRFSPVGLPPEQARCVTAPPKHTASAQSDAPSRRGFMRASAKIDAWAGGVMLFQLWCKGQPYKSVSLCKGGGAPCVKNFVASLAALDETEPVDFSSCNAEMPPSVQAAVRGLLGVDPNKRMCSHCALMKLMGVDYAAETEEEEGEF